MRFWGRSSLLLVTCSLASAQTAPPVSKKPIQKANELILAGIRPGLDTLQKAIHLYGEPLSPPEHQGDSSWKDYCHWNSLSVDRDHRGKIETIRVSRISRVLTADCFDKAKPDAWRTGRGLRVGDWPAKVVELYGEPDSRSPSTRDGQPLELLYYAFDWAGADVPQVMEVLCTKEKDGVPARVIEITLA